MLLHLTWAVAAHHLLELLELSKREVFSILMCHPVLSMARYQTVGHPQVPGYKGSPRPKTAWRVLVLEKGTREYDRLRVLPYQNCVQHNVTWQTHSNYVCIGWERKIAPIAGVLNN